jgi:dihydropteroate synthase
VAILARALCVERVRDFEWAFARLRLPGPAGEYLLEKAPHVQVLLTGLGLTEGRFLRAAAEASTAHGREELPSFVPGDQRSRPGSALVSGRKDQLDRLISRARAEGLAELVAALEGVWRGQEIPPPLRLRDRELVFGQRTYVMGVVNVTPDSFSDGGKTFAPEQAVAHGLALAEAGADVLDIGGESTRPGAAPVEANEELRRILPVIEGLRARTQVPLSIDTTKAAVAERALASGACMVNDISGFSAEPRLAEVTARAGAACVLMHRQGSPATMQQDPRYGDVVEEVILGLKDALARALAAGIPRERICVDPGIGFGKTLGHNLALLRRLEDLRTLGHPVLVGTSRKAFLGTLAGGRPVEGRLPGTLASVVTAAVLAGVDWVRVHDVSECRDALAIAWAIRGAADGGALYDRKTRLAE